MSRGTGELQFTEGCHWTARDWARAARLEQEHWENYGDLGDAIYSMAVADTLFQVLGDHGLVQGRARMDLIRARYAALRQL